MTTMGKCYPYLRVITDTRANLNLASVMTCHTRFLCQNQVLIVCMTHDEWFHTYGLKVFTDNQMSWIKYNYTNNVSKDCDNSQAKQNSGRLHNSTATTTGATHTLELLIEEFQSIFSFWVTGLSSRVKQQGWVHLWLVLSKCRNNMICKGNIKVNKG
jgi:hypothetical protein